MVLTFPYTVYMRERGELKNIVACEVSGEEYASLQNAAETYETFLQCEELNDLYDRIFWIACDHATRYVRTYPELFEEDIRINAKCSTWDITDQFALGVSFPLFS